MGKGVVVALVLLVGLLCYLSHEGVTVKSAVNWLQYQCGIQGGSSDRQGAPHPNYIPVVR